MKYIAASWKYLKYLIWLGLMLTTAGLVAGTLSSWDPLSIGLLIGGLVLCGLWLLLLGQAQPGFWGRRSTQAGTNAFVATLSVVVILVALNLLGSRYSSRIDLTENQVFTLAPESQSIVQDLEQPARVLVFDVSRNPQDQQLLESYQRYNSQFSYEYVDPNAQPRLAQEFGVRTLGEVHLKVGDKNQLVQRLNQAERLSEPRLTNQLVQIVRDRAPKAYFVVGHGEYDIENIQGGFAQARTTLEEKSYEVAPLDLSRTGAVPEDADVVIVAGPQQAFFDAEVRALETYLNQGGGLLLLVDPNTDPNLDGLLDDWGVTLSDRLILDTSGQGQVVGLGPAAPLVTNYGEHPITQAFERGRSFYPLARPVELDPPEAVTATAILLTDEQTQAEQVSADGNLSVDPNQPPQGPLTLGVALSRTAQSTPPSAPTASAGAESDADAAITEDATAENPEAVEPEAIASPSETASAVEDAPSAEANPETASTDEANEEQPQEDAEPDEATETEAPAESAEPENSAEARLVVIGNSSFATDGLFNQQLNGDVFLNAVSWLSQQDDATLSIRPKEVTNRRILMSPQEQIGLGIFSWLVLPLIGFAIAFVLWWRRR